MFFFLKKYTEQTDCQGCGREYKTCDLQYDAMTDGWFCYYCTDESVCAGCGNEQPKHELEYLVMYNAHYCKSCVKDDEPC